jgi:hypothetical protein
MSTEVPGRPRKSVAVTILGLSTLLLGGGYGAQGGQLILAGTSWFAQPEQQQKAPLGPIGPAVLIVFGVAFLPLGLLGLLAGAGVLLRNQWGRILAFVLAVLAILLGLVWLGGGDGNVTEIALGAAQVLYGILALAVLIRQREEFSRPRIEANSS